MLCVLIKFLSHASAKKEDKKGLKGFRFYTFTGVFKWHHSSEGVKQLVRPPNGLACSNPDAGAVSDWRVGGAERALGCHGRLAKHDTSWSSHGWIYTCFVLDSASCLSLIICHNYDIRGHKEPRKKKLCVRARVLFESLCFNACICVSVL